MGETIRESKGDIQTSYINCISNIDSSDDDMLEHKIDGLDVLSADFNNSRSNG